MKNILLIFLIINFNSIAIGSIKENIINNLVKIDNFKFNFEQNINGKIERGNCIIKYPKKIFCKYTKTNGKILVSNGKSLVIQTKNGTYYRYAINRTPLNYILDKKFLINQINFLEERVIDNKFVNFTIFKDENEINIFFDNKSFNLIGWQVLDIYQNLNITYIDINQINQNLNKDLFNLPKQN
tara:strand:+ start:732 stop:1283 length:552 start_codon:yes stop_codon:yes gene_type:complete